MGIFDFLKGKSKNSNQTPSNPPENQPVEQPPDNVIDFETYKACREVSKSRYLTKKEKQAILSANLTANHMKGNVIEAIRRGIEYD